MVHKRTFSDTHEPGSPEGPYEGGNEAALDLKYNSDMIEVIDFISNLRSEGSKSLHVALDLRELGIVLHLVRNHFGGRLTTRSSLAQASGLSYGSAYRAIEVMLSDGLIVQRERTATGRSFSLHPSVELLARWQDFARQIKRSVDESFVSSRRTGTRPKRARRQSEQSGFISPPTVLEKKLTLPRGLRVLVHADPTFMTMDALKQQFEMILGVRINSRALSIDRLRREIVANSEQRVSAYDIVACDLPWFGDMVEKGRLLALNGLIEISGLDLSDFIPDAVASARRNDIQFGIPVLNTAELLVYRKDLFDESGLAAPKTTDLVLRSARALHDPAKGRFGIAWNGGRGTALGHTFMVVMAAHGQPIVDLRREGDGFAMEEATGEELRPMFLSSAARATAEYLLEILAFSPPKILSMTWYDRARHYATGKVGMAYCHTLLANLFELDKSSPAYGNTGYLSQPTALDGRQISPLGGYALAIPNNISPERVGDVWTAMQTLTSRGAAKVFVANGSLASPRFSVNNDPEARSLSPIVGFVDQLAQSGTLRAWPRPPVPGISAIINIAGEEIHDMLSGKQSLDRALENAQNRADALMRERGYY